MHRTFFWLKISMRRASYIFLLELGGSSSWIGLEDHLGAKLYSVYSVLFLGGERLQKHYSFSGEE